MNLGLDFEAQRFANMQEKQKLLEELNLTASHARMVGKGEVKAEQQLTRGRRRRPSKSPNQSPKKPSRTSARIATVQTRRSHNERKHPVDMNMDIDMADTGSSSRRKTRSRSSRGVRVSHHQATQQAETSISKPLSPSLPTDLASLLQRYNSWTPSAPLPTLNPHTNTYHFGSHAQFRPNKSPLAILLEGAFGGSFFSPWHSRTLSVTLVDDHLSTLPAEWLTQLQPAERYITAPRYSAELNRHGRPCGQTLTQWEEAGWINFRHDARGWFEWYVRFWLGRRLDDGEDERQIGRWLRCVGPKGRWKQMLLKKYVEMGVRSVFDDDDDAADEERKVSPVMHQTCLHWGYQVTQEDLDDAWRESSGGAS